MKAFYLVHIAPVNNDNFASSFKIVTYLSIFANTLRTLLMIVVTMDVLYSFLILMGVTLIFQHCVEN